MRRESRSWKGITALIAATFGLGVAAIPAAAELHSVTVVLVTGQRIQTTVDVPPGTPVSSVSIPGITGTIEQVIDNGPSSTPTPIPTPAPPVPTIPGASSPALTPTPDGNKTPGAPNRNEGGKPNDPGFTRAHVRQPNKSFSVGNINSKKLVGQLERGAPRKTVRKPQAGRTVGGAPTAANPTFSPAMPGPAQIGVPNFFIDKFRIPPFLLPLYQAAGIEYGVRWEVLAAINEIETDYGRDLNVSSAGALGWMQFMPETWKQYGVDANKDGLRDPYSPVDAIFAAARYLKAAGAETDVRKALFAYNHAGWYVDSVLMRARLIGGLPADFVGSLTGLTQGRFPVHANATFAGQLDKRDTKRKTARGQNAAFIVQADRRRRGIEIYARRDSPVIAVNDGRVVRMGETKRLGRYIQLQDVYGNTYTYARLATVAKTYPAPRPRTPTPKDVRIKKLRPGSRIVAGTLLGRIGHTSSTKAPHMLFEIRPAGRSAPRIDPKPILDGWKLLESTAIYRAAGKNPFFGPDAKTASIGQILLMSKEALIADVLANPRIEIYSCGRNDIRTGQIDLRVLATLEFLAASGFRPTVSTLKCGHSYLTSSGNVSEHSTGNAADIARINGIPILGNQGKGSITELVIRRLLTLQGTMKADQIISLMTFQGTDNTLAMSDHADHIHIGWKPLYGTNSKAVKQVNAVLKPKQWIKLIDRLKEIDNPTVRLQPSKHALKVTERASGAHTGE